MSVTMMVVDDEPDLESLIRQKFRKQIREGEYEFVFAQNGLDALGKLVDRPDISVILSDINMPEMDGLTLLHKLGDLNNPALKAVIVSAYGDMENIRTAMNRGAFDFITKPIDFTDLEVTLNKTLLQLHIIKQALHEHEALLSVQRDLNIAARIQQSILPRRFPPFPERNEIDIYAMMQPAKEVGGDFYDFFLLDGDRLGLVVGDVSGKGIPAAIFMALSRTVLKTIAVRAENPGDCLEQVNRMLIPESDIAMFVTIFYATLNLRTGEMEYSIGGHNPPYLIGPGGAITPLERAGGPFLGKVKGLLFKTGSVVLKPGERVFAFTDGVTEAMDGGANQFEEERLVASLRRSAGLSLDRVLGELSAELKSFAGPTLQSDDITMLAVQFNGSNGRPP